MVKKFETKVNILGELSEKMTRWIGTPYSIILHTILFIGIFILRIFGVSIEELLLILTTAVSLEAIYLAIFIQMTVNRNTASLELVEDEIEELSEDVEDISEDIDQIQSEEEDSEEEKTKQTLQNIELQLQKIHEGLEVLKKKGLL